MRSKVIGVFSAVSLSLNLSILALMLLSFPLAILIPFSDLSKAPAEGVVLYLFGIPLRLEARIDPVVGILALTAVYSALMAILMKGRSFRAELPYENDALSLAATFSALTVILQLIDYVQEAFGVEVGEISVCEPLYHLFYVSLSPITEEIGFRLCLIGVLGLVITGLRRDRLKALLRPKGRMDGWRIHVLILFSSVLFAYFHLLGGWKLGKFTEALVAGYVLGRVYYSKGILNAIMLHWSFNYFTSSLYCFDLAYGTQFGTVLDWLAPFAGAVTILTLVLLHLSGSLDLKKMLLDPDAF